MELSFKDGNKFHASIKESDEDGEVLLTYYTDSNGEVVNGTVTCSVNCASGRSASATCSEEAKKSARGGCRDGHPWLTC